MKKWLNEGNSKHSFIRLRIRDPNIQRCTISWNPQPEDLFTQLVFVLVFAYCLSSAPQLVRMVSLGRTRRSCPLAARSSDRSCDRTPMLTPSFTYAASSRYGTIIKAILLLVILFRRPQGTYSVRICGIHLLQLPGPDPGAL